MKAVTTREKLSSDYRFNSQPTKCLEYSSNSPTPEKKKSKTLAKVVKEEVAEKGSHSGTISSSEPVKDNQQNILEEYKALLEQLAKMKTVCDRLKQNNLRRDLDLLQSSLAKYERSTRGRNMVPFLMKGSFKETKKFSNLL